MSLLLLHSSVILVWKFCFVLVIQFGSNRFRFYSVVVHLKSIQFSSYLVLIPENKSFFRSYSLPVLEILTIFVRFSFWKTKHYMSWPGSQTLESNTASLPIIGKQTALNF